ncbi:MAG: serine/threonine-protein kinase PknK, partial [Anaerolineae bacterium]|nr:serine/threonine-protein kinase PknK [Anaerolineae bacterium]
MQEQIGAGGFGAVYRAVQPSIGREVAIKIILPQYANQPEFIRRFETEAQLVARLEHPHIVPLYDYWRDPNGAYLVMRYLRGGSLRDSLEEHGAWEPARVVRLLNQISAALTFAHVNGVIHRDLKTDNILIDEMGNTYLTDFGIAKDLGREENLTKDNILGTPAYLAPEQIRGQVATPQSDIYALGIMTFEALTGHKPFYDVTPATVLFKQLHDPLPDITEFVPNLPPAINMFLQRATSKDPEMRYDTTLAFARDLASLIRESAPGMPSGTPTMDVSITEAEEAIFAPQNPYKGLRAFQQADSDHFFGREELIDRLLTYLSTIGDKNRFLAVVGPSGSGKSSVVKAGLLPQIAHKQLDQEIDWFVVELVPGTHPLEELEAAGLSIARDEMPGLLGMLQENDRGLVRAVKRILPDENSELVIFIDQFEEVFT